MRLSVFGRSLLSLCLCSCILYGLGCTKPVKVSAFSDGAYLSASDLHDLLGDTLSAEIADTSFGNPEIRTMTLSYNGPVTVSGSTSADIPDGSPALQYSISAPNLYNNPSFITLDLSLFYSILDTYQFHGWIAAGGKGITWQTAIPPYQSPQWRVHVGGTQTTFETGASGGVLDAVRLMQSGNYSHYFHAVTADVSQNSTFDFSSVRVTFSDVYSDGGTLYVLIGCPYISLDSSAITGTVATTQATQTTTTAVNVDVNVDMSETNGILAGLADAIIDGIKSLFLPTEAQLNAFVQQMRILLEDHLGGLYQAVAAIVDFCESLPDVTAKTSITAPTITVPLAGESWTLGGWDVQLKYSQFSVLYDGIAWIIDFIATAAFLNMLKKKLEIMLVPESEKVE